MHERLGRKNKGGKSGGTHKKTNLIEDIANDNYENLIEI
mgnify:FL=1